jgi:hypothetical protein
MIGIFILYIIGVLLSLAAANAIVEDIDTIDISALLHIMLLLIVMCLFSFLGLIVILIFNLSLRNEYPDNAPKDWFNFKI